MTRMNIFRNLLVVSITCIAMNIQLQAQDKNFYIYICFGQSNMEGQGNIETKDRTVDNRFKVFQALDCSNLARTKATWYKALPPTCQCYSRLSPADYFGRTMVANLPDSISIGIINVSVGGCDIRLFDKDIYTDYDSTYTESWFTSKVLSYNGNPYQYLIDLAKLAQQDGVIKGILLHQGETNTGNNQWPSYVQKIYNDMIADLSLDTTEVPLLAGEVLQTSGSCCSSMNTIINKLPQTLPNSYVISSAGCPGQDNAHFNSEGYRILGRRYAVQMLSLMGYTTHYAEVECGTVGNDWYILSDKNASNTRYVTAKPGLESKNSAPTQTDAIIPMSFSIDKDTTYYIYGRFNNPSNTSDAFWLQINDEPFILCDDLTTSGWEWKELTHIDLQAGTHTIKIAYAEQGASIDKIAIKNAQIPPSSVGEEANNICDAPIINNLNSVDDLHNNLGQNFPNPVIKNTTIPFSVVAETHVTIKLYNTQGVEVSEILSKTCNAGNHTVEWKRKNIPSGLYYYTITTNDFTSTRSLLIK